METLLACGSVNGRPWRFLARVGHLDDPLRVSVHADEAPRVVLIHKVNSGHIWLDVSIKHSLHPAIIEVLLGLLAPVLNPDLLLLAQLLLLLLLLNFLRRR